MGIGFPGIIVLYKEGVTVISCGRLKPVVLNEPTNSRMVGKNEAACAADAAREVVERWLPNG